MSEDAGLNELLNSDSDDAGRRFAAGRTVAELHRLEELGIMQKNGYDEETGDALWSVSKKMHELVDALEIDTDDPSEEDMELLHKAVGGVIEEGGVDELIEVLNENVAGEG